MAASPGIWVDGEPATGLPLPDRGLDFGDGLFETLLVRRGEPLFTDLHLERLQAGLQVLGFPACLELANSYLQKACSALADTEWAALRLTITRGSAPRGYAPPLNTTPRMIITVAPLAQDRSSFPQPLTLGWADIRWSSQPMLAGIKHLNRLEQVMAAREAESQGCDEVLVLGPGGEVNSASAGNLFAVVDAILLTPVLETCGIFGTRRRLVIERWAPQLGIPVEQVALTPEQVEAADELFICNSLRGLQPVAALGTRRWRAHPVCRQLHALYSESLG